MTNLVSIGVVVVALVVSACDDGGGTCPGTGPISCSVVRANELECSAAALCVQAGSCGAAGTCCYCEDGAWKTLQVSCPACDAGVDAPPDAP